MVYVSLLMVSLVLTSWLGVFSWQRRYTPGVTAFSIMMFVGAMWLAIITLMLVSPSTGMALFWYRLGFICVSASPVLLFIFIAQYSGASLVTPLRVLALLVVPLLTQTMVWTDDRFHLFFKTIYIVEKNDLMVIHSWSSGPWFLVHSAYSFILLLVSLVWLFVYAVRQFRVFRGQSTAFILGALMVILPNLAFALGLIPPDVIVLPFCFLFMGLFFAWAIFRHKLFEVVPVARNKMVDMMSDGMIVLDIDNRVLDMNPAARTSLFPVGRDVIGQPARQVFSPWPDILERFADTTWTRTELCITSGPGPMYYDVRITGLDNKAGRPAGRLILFRDITERKSIEREKDRLVEDLNRKNKELEMWYGMALDANPMTGLPGNNSIAAAIGQAIKDGEPLCVIYTDLDNFKAFNDHYGFAHGDEVIKFTADVLKRSLVHADCEQCFIGHIGGDDFVLLVPSDQAEAIVDFIIKDFDTQVGKYYDENDLVRGFISSTNRQGVGENFPIMTISMAGVDLSHRFYREYIEVNDACAALKKQAKAKPGSSCSFDQRGGLNRQL